MSTDRQNWPEAMATVLHCHYETRAGRALAFSLPSSRRFHITYNYWVAGELHEADFYAIQAMPQGSLFPIRYDPDRPWTNHHTRSESQAKAVPLLAVGIAGSAVLSLAWLLVMRGCS